MLAVSFSHPCIPNRCLNRQALVAIDHYYARNCSKHQQAYVSRGNFVLSPRNQHLRSAVLYILCASSTKDQYVWVEDLLMGLRCTHDSVVLDPLEVMTY
jgi:hypothetical protein